MDICIPCSPSLASIFATVRGKRGVFTSVATRNLTLLFVSQALQENLKLLKEDENEREATRAAIAEEDAAARRCEADRLAEEEKKVSGK